MYILILIISLKSQFNHSLDIKTINNINSEQICNSIGKKMSLELTNFDHDVQTKYYCEQNLYTK